MRSARVLLAAAAGLLASGPAAPPQDDQVYVDEIKQDFLEKIRRCEENKDWKGLFDHYAHALKRYASRVVKLDKDRWTGVGEYLLERFSKLPRAAFDHYRLEHDGHARVEFDRALGEGSRRGREKAVEEFFFSSYTDENLDLLARECVEEGRPNEAIHYWNRLLRYYPDSEIPREVTAARLAHACLIAGNEAALADLRRHVGAAKVRGRIVVGGRETELSDFLDSARVPAPPPVARPARVPFARGADEPHFENPVGVRNEIRRWTYDFAADRGEPVGEAPPAPAPNPRGVIIRRPGYAQPPQTNEFPFFPAHARIGGRDYVLATDGTRVVAFDPGRVTGTSTTAGIYWKYPGPGAIARPNVRAGMAEYVLYKPYIGVTVDGEYAYAAMYSATRMREVNPQIPDLFEGATALKCFHIPTGKLVWDTDQGPIADLFKADKQFDYHERNFSYSSPVLVRGGRVYAGICTSPMGEQESRVLCLDQKTGRPLWCTLLASILSGGGRNPFGTDWRTVVYQTLLAEQGGAIYVNTNLGVMASLNGVTGSVQWLTGYRRSVVRAQHGMMQPTFIRPANWPVLWKGRVLILPQDADSLLAFDLLGGQPIVLPEEVKSREDFQWKLMSHLLGVVDDWLVVGGGRNSHVVRLQDFQAYPLASSDAQRTGRGVIAGDLIYLPVLNSSNNIGALAVYDVATFKNLDQVPWKEDREFGNLLVAGSSLVVSAARLTVYSDAATLRREFVHRLRQSPPHPEALLEYGEAMRANLRLEDAAESYLGFIRAAEGDPRHDARVRQVKTDLHHIFLRRGDEAAERDDLALALEHYAMARKFAHDAKSGAEATRKLAETSEKLRRWKEAVGFWQELIEKGRDEYHRDREKVSKLWQHARNRIDEIVKEAPEAYEEVEKRAAETLRAARDRGVDALKDVMDRFPNSKTARDAWQRIFDTLLKEGKLDKLRALYDELEERFRVNLNFDATRKLLDLLEKLKDLKRLEFEMGRFGERFGAEQIGQEAVRDYVERRLRELERPPAPAPAAGPLRKLGEMEAGQAAPDPQGVEAGAVPLRPLGVEPPEFARELELFARGSSVELWDLKGHRRLWACPRPGGYLGVVFMDAGADDAGPAIQSVRAGSPAERAGLARGDVLVSLDGAPVRADTLSDRLAALAPGATVALAYRRGGREAVARVELGAWPPDLRPALVGASFTRDYALAVAWEDAVASIDLATGGVQWTFRAVRDRFHLRAFHATDGRLYVYEARRPDRDRDVLRTHSPQATQERLVFRPEDAHERLLCLDDFTGELAWGRAFDLDPGAPAAPTQVHFHGKYLGEHVVLLQSVPRASQDNWALLVLSARDGEGGRYALPGRLLAWTFEPAGGVFYYVTMGSDASQRTLQSLSTDPANKEWKRVDFPALNVKYMPPAHQACTLAANREYVCLVVPPASPAQPDYRIWVFHAATGKEFRSIPLLEGRTLPALAHVPGRVLPSAVLGPDGLLYVYNVPRDRGAAAGPGRGYLTAFRLGAKEGADETAWDAVAPALGPNAAWWCLPEPRHFAVLSAQRASAPGAAGEGAMALVYDRASEGYIQMVLTDLAPPTDLSGQPANPLAWWRGRLYVSARTGLQIYGAE